MGLFCLSYIWTKKYYCILLVLLWNVIPIDVSLLSFWWSCIFFDSWTFWPVILPFSSQRQSKRPVRVYFNQNQLSDASLLISILSENLIWTEMRIYLRKRSEFEAPLFLKFGCQNKFKLFEFAPDLPSPCKIALLISQSHKGAYAGEWLMKKEKEYYWESFKYVSLMCREKMEIDSVRNLVFLQSWGHIVLIGETQRRSRCLLFMTKMCL